MQRFTTLLSIFALLVTGLSTSTTLAQGDDFLPFDEATGDVPDDFEQVLYAEVHEWIEYCWHWYETETWPEESEGFSFTYEQNLPMGWTPFAEAYDEFEAMYADQLQLDPYAGDLYLLEDLFEEDPAILEEFKVYTMTDFYRSGTNNVSRNLGTADPDEDDPPAQPIPCDELPPEICEFMQELENYVHSSCVQFVPYKADYPFIFPGFDCDDYTDALWAWLKHKQDAGEISEDVEFEALWLWWHFSWGGVQAVNTEKRDTRF